MNEARVADDARREARGWQGSPAVGRHLIDPRDGQWAGSLPLSHASFFSGIGGLDLGFERAGWSTVTHSEIEPYASAVLAHHWPDVPNLGDIVALAAAARGGERRPDLAAATLWSGGFPCQDLSIAGKRAGIGGARSGLAFSFLDLVSAYRPPVILFENVMGLFSSNSGRDFGRLISEVAALGYMGSFRALDAQWFGVAQRRRRVFVLAFNQDTFGDLAERCAYTVLFDPEGSGGHPAAHRGPGQNASRDLARSVTASSWKRHDPDTDTYVVEGATAHSAGVRTPDGLPGRLDDRPAVVGPLLAAEGRGWRVGADEAGAGHIQVDVQPRFDDESLAKLDTPRFKACGNGVVTPVAEWIATNLRDIIQGGVL